MGKSKKDSTSKRVKVIGHEQWKTHIQGRLKIFKSYEPRIGILTFIKSGYNQSSILLILSAIKRPN